jgi:hypothetical protein
LFQFSDVLKKLLILLAVPFNLIALVNLKRTDERKEKIENFVHGLAGK